MALTVPDLIKHIFEYRGDFGTLGGVNTTFRAQAKKSTRAGLTMIQETFGGTPGAPGELLRERYLTARSGEGEGTDGLNILLNNLRLQHGTRQTKALIDGHLNPAAIIDDLKEDINHSKLYFALALFINLEDIRELLEPPEHDQIGALGATEWFDACFTPWFEAQKTTLQDTFRPPIMFCFPSSDKVTSFLARHDLTAHVPDPKELCRVSILPSFAKTFIRSPMRPYVTPHMRMKNDTLANRLVLEKAPLTAAHVAALPNALKNHIYEEIFFRSGRPSTTDAHWGETHAGDDPDLLRRTTFEILVHHPYLSPTLSLVGRACYHIWNADGRPDELEYGEKHLFDDPDKMRLAVAEATSDCGVDQFLTLSPLAAAGYDYMVWKAMGKPEGRLASLTAEDRFESPGRRDAAMQTANEVRHLLRKTLVRIQSLPDPVIPPRIMYCCVGSFFEEDSEMRGELPELTSRVREEIDRRVAHASLSLEEDERVPDGVPHQSLIQMGVHPEMIPGIFEAPLEAPLHGGEADGPA